VAPNRVRFKKDFNTVLKDTAIPTIFDYPLKFDFPSEPKQAGKKRTKTIKVNDR
jgi:hypothetical protein